MKLNNKILLGNALLSVFMMALTGLLMYYVVNSTIYDELDFHLLQHKNDIERQLNRNPESLLDLKQLGGLGSYEWIEISPVAPADLKTENSFSTIDTVRFSNLSDMPETYRALKTGLLIGDKAYQLHIYEEVASWEKISATVFLSLLAALFIWVILLYVMNQYALGRILAPFYETVDRLDQISSPMQTGRPFPQSNTYEIDVLNKALNTMLAQIKSSFEDQKKFIQNASHELLTPLSIIRQKAENMLSESESLSRDTIERLNEIQQTTVRLTRLSNALLLISRVENLQFEMNEEVKVQEITEHVLAELNDFINLKNLRIEKELKEEISLTGNRELIHSAIYNILQNAIKFSPDGGSIVISTKQLEAGRKEFSVADEGPGIPAKYINEVFDRFKKGGSFAAEANESPGLGLSIVQSICELHGLTCEARANKEKGVTIFIVF